ncbi:MAG: DeoR/GlpR family DNA-binding transcription regulator, partial [Microvirga sp.]
MIDPAATAPGARRDARERQELIVDAIARQGAISVAAVARACGVTTQTIRRDLVALGSRGLVHKAHGAAFAGPGTVVHPYKDRSATQVDVKRRLVLRLAEFIEPGATVFVGLGTTFNSLHEILRDGPQIVLATNNLGVAYHCTFNTGVTLFVFGGYLRRNDTAILAATEGGLSDRFKFDVAILGASAVDEDGAFLAYDPLEAEFTREVIRASRKVVFVIQDEKFGRRAPHVVAHMADVSVLITNCDARSKISDPA